MDKTNNYRMDLFLKDGSKKLCLITRRVNATDNGSGLDVLSECS